jgi:carboxyl-terminal processing protease
MATDNTQSRQSTDQISKALPVQIVQSSQNFWQDAYDGPPATANHGNNTEARAKSAEKLAAGPVKPCSPSPEYQKFIDIALNQAYSPELFGDPKIVRHEFDCQIHSGQDAIKFANEVLKRSGDSHTKILPPADNQSMSATSDPSSIGIGIKTSFDARNSSPGKEHGLTVYRTYPDSPATQAGLKTGDTILSVDSHDLTRLSNDDANDRLEGTAGSVAHLLVERDGQLVSIDAVRKKFKQPSVSDASLPDNLAYISIEDFRNEHLADQLRAALLKHQDAKGFVIDLRRNGGGNVDLANLALSEVMNDGVIMKVRERNVDDKDHISYLSGSYTLKPDGIVLSEKPENQQNSYRLGNTNEVVDFGDDSEPVKETNARMRNLVGDRPITILTDGLTASAAEIFTGAMHDTGKARTIGTTTYGKGIGGLYTWKDLPMGAGEIVTNMRYYTPSGVCPGDAEKNKHGLKPDKVVENPYGAIPLTAADVQLIAAEDDLKETLRKRNK